MTNTLTTLTIGNAGFESGVKSPWVTTVASAAPVFNVASIPGWGGTQPPHTGSFQMWPGNVDLTLGNSFWQDFDVSAYASYIDAATCTIAGLTAWHQTNQVGNNGDLMLLLYDVSNTLTASYYVIGPTIEFGTGWHQRVMGSQIVPVHTRTVRIGTRNYIGVGPSITSLWDDFVSPTLETSGPIGVTNDFEISFPASGTLTFAALDVSEPVPSIIQGLDLTFRGDLRLSLGLQKFPIFDCPAPVAKTWARATVTPKTWDCVTVVPAEECDGVDDSTFDWLEAVDGSDFASVSDYQIKAA